ncbi:MAG: hypothetical protein V3W44_08950 [Dehalococcoidales bacterium]
MFPFFSGLIEHFACILKLTALSSTHLVVNPTDAHAGIRATRTGHIQELVNGVTWTSQLPTSEWFTQACKTATIGDSYRVKLVKSTGSDPDSGPALGTWFVINTGRQWQWDQLVVGEKVFTGTLSIEETADSSNVVSASVTISAEVDAG